MLEVVLGLSKSMMSVLGRMELNGSSGYQDKNMEF